jgi:hypothetical protein
VVVAVRRLEAPVPVVLPMVSSLLWPLPPSSFGVGVTVELRLGGGRCSVIPR